MELALYRNDIVSLSKKYDYLDVDYENDLIKDYQENDNKQSAQKVILHNLKVVTHYAYKFRHNFLLSDLHNTGIIGLFNALKHFDINKGVRFMTFAFHWVKNSIFTFFADNISEISYRNNQDFKKLFTKKENVEINNLYSNQHVRLAYSPSESKISYSESNEDYDTTMFPVVIEDNDQNLDEDTIITKVKSIMSKFNDRDYYIIYEHFFNEKSFVEISKELNLSKQRINQRYYILMDLIKRKMQNYKY